MGKNLILIICLTISFQATWATSSQSKVARLENLTKEEKGERDRSMLTRLRAVVIDAGTEVAKVVEVNNKFYRLNNLGEPLNGHSRLVKYIKVDVNGEIKWLLDKPEYYWRHYKGKKRTIIFETALISNDEFEKMFPVVAKAPVAEVNAPVSLPSSSTRRSEAAQ